MNFEQAFKEGDIEEGREYVEADFNRVIEIKAREEYRVKLFMSLINQTKKPWSFVRPKFMLLLSEI
nr:hypothetical protein [uncultured Psychrobacter sp.]